MKRNERTKRSLIVNCLAGVLTAVITFFFMALGQTGGTWLVAVPLTVLAATVGASVLRYRTRSKQPQRG